MSGHDSRTYDINHSTNPHKLRRSVVPNVSDQQDSDGLAFVLAEYLAQIDRGETVCRETFLANHPEHVAALQGYFADVDLIERLSGASAETLPFAPTATPRTFGDYDLLEEIGRGGMGIVYRASERSTGRIVALKMLRHSLFLSSAEVLRFRNEASTAAVLRHPGIIPIYHVGEYQGHLFYTMPLIRGINLAQRITGSPPEPTVAARLLLAVAEAVAFAHSRNVVHRDLKPANVLLDEQEHTYVADFGLARNLGEEQPGLTVTGDMLGTPNYMAPEQVSGHHTHVGPPADVYAMGAVLYALLVGQPPFRSDSVPETLHKICSTDPAPPRQKDYRVPRDLETICLKCLEKSPANRYASAAALADDLRRFLAGEPLFAQRVSRLERGRRWFVRNPVVGTLAVGVVLALVAGTVFSTYYAVRAGKREQQAVASLYAADMNLAQQQVRSGAVNSALQLLERHRPPLSLPTTPSSGPAADAPPWEWNYLWHQCHGELCRFQGPQGAIYAADFSSDGRTIAAAGDDQTAWLWETATGKLLFKLAGHTAAVHGLAYAPDGKRLATVSDDGACRIWDTTTGNALATLNHQPSTLNHPLTTIAFSADGRLIATGGSDEGKVNVWDAALFTLRQSLDLGPAECVAFAPAAKKLAIAGRDGCIRICECSETGVWTTKATIRAHADVVRKVVWSPDGLRLATAGSDHLVKIWDTGSWADLSEISGFQDAIHCLAFRPDGQRLAMAARNEPLKVWDLAQQRFVAELAGHSALVTSVAFCPLGWRLLSASEDGTVRLWDADQSSHHDRLEGSFSRVRAIDFSPDSKTLATGSSDGSDIILWDVQSSLPRQVLHSQRLGTADLKFSPNGKYLASVGRTHLESWNVATKELAIGIEMPGATVAGLAWAPTGDRITVQKVDGTIAIVDAGNGSSISSWRAPDRPHGGIAFSPDGAELVTTSVHGVVQIWDVATQSIRHELVGHLGPVVCVAYSPNGSLIASSAIDDTIRLWDARTGRHLRTLVGHSGTSLGLVFSPDSTRLASGSTDRQVKLWNVETGFELQSLPGNTDWALNVAFSPDGQLLASGGGDGIIRIWRAPFISPPRYSGQALGEAMLGEVNQAADRATTREAAALVKHLAARFPARESLVTQINFDTTISTAVRAAATAQADDFLLYWLPMCDGVRAAEHRDWHKAIAAFERATALAPQNCDLWRQLALASAVSGHVDAYERACRELSAFFNSNSKGEDLGIIVSTTLLLPPNGRDRTPIKPMVDQFAERAEMGRVYAALYDLRLGRKTSAANLVDPRQFTRLPHSEEFFIMSMVLARTGDMQQAIAYYEAGLHIARTNPPTNWIQEALNEIFQREAAGIIKDRSAADGSKSHAVSPGPASPSGPPPANVPAETSPSLAPK